MFDIGIFGVGAVVFALLLLAFLVPELRSEVQETETIFKTADGQIVKVIRDDKVKAADGIKEIERDGDAEDEDVVGWAYEAGALEQLIYPVL